MNLYPFAKAVVHLFVSVAYRMSYEGLENIPKDQGFILACNHIKAIDPLFIAPKVPQQLNFMAKIELFKNRFLCWFFKSLGAFPVDRGKGDTGALDEARRRVESGKVLAMFIEGHRSEDGKPLRPRSGVALIAGQTGADVLPCAIICDKKLGFRSRVTVRYGKLIKNGELNIDPAAPSTLRVAAKAIMGDILELIDGAEAKEGGEQ